MSEDLSGLGYKLEEGIWCKTHSNDGPSYQGHRSSGKRKLSVEQVRTLVRSYSNGKMTIPELVQYYQVSRHTISKHLKNRYKRQQD